MVVNKGFVAVLLSYCFDGEALYDRWLQSLLMLFIKMLLGQIIGRLRICLIAWEMTLVNSRERSYCL